MGTDRSQVFSGPCPCGSGRLEVDHCTKDHAFADPDQYWYDAKVNCAKCSEVYELRKSGRSFGLFDRHVRERNEERSRGAWEQKQAILQSEAAKKHLGDLAALLDRQQSLAAVHRLLDGVELWVSNIAKFRKLWRGGAEWVTHNSPEIEKVLKVLGARDDALLDRLKEVDEYPNEVDAMIGEPVYTLPREA